jgi:hypothetical protein
MFCAAIPAVAAVGAKINADQNRKAEARRLPIPKLTAGVIALLVVCSAIYHTLTYRS